MSSLMNNLHRYTVNNNFKMVLDKNNQPIKAAVRAYRYLNGKSTNRCDVFSRTLYSCSGHTIFVISSHVFEERFDYKETTKNMKGSNHDLSNCELVLLPTSKGIEYLRCSFRKSWLEFRIDEDAVNPKLHGIMNCTDTILRYLSNINTRFDYLGHPIFQ